MQIDSIEKGTKKKKSSKGKTQQASIVNLKIEANEDGTFLAKVFTKYSTVEKTAYSPLNAYRRAMKGLS